MKAQSALAAQRRNKSVKRLMNALLLSAAFVAAYGGFAAMSCEAKGSPDACIGGGGDCLDIQGLIDGAAANGGGRVVVPAGRHLVGQIDLRSNIELHFEKGAVLEGKVGLENYRVTTLPYSEGTWSAVVSAIGVTNVAITGEGEALSSVASSITGVAGKYPDAHMFGCILPAYGLYARHVDGLSLEDVSFVLKPGTTDGRDDKVLDDVMSIQAF